MILPGLPAGRYQAYWLILDQERELSAVWHKQTDTNCNASGNFFYGSWEIS